MLPELFRQVRYESAVTFQTLLESNVRDAVFAVFPELIAPVRDEPLLSEIVIALTLSATKLPLSVCPLAVKITVPPFEPLTPQFPALAFNSVPDAAVTLTPFSVIMPVEFVT